MDQFRHDFIDEIECSTIVVYDVVSVKRATLYQSDVIKSSKCL